MEASVFLSISPETAGSAVLTSWIPPASTVTVCAAFPSSSLTSFVTV
jgi:hypothetical protein